MPVKIALPKGRYLGETSRLLQEAGWGLSDYQEGARVYRLKSQRFPDLFAKMFHEKDIPIQVAVGNYDLGICGLDWAEELLAKYPSSTLVKVNNLGYGEGLLSVVAGRSGGMSTVEEIRARSDNIRIASEYVNLAESFALNLRLRRFNIFPLWGAAEVYPPESADLALIPGEGDGKFLDYGLVPVSQVLRFSCFLIANRDSWASKDMGDILTSIEDKVVVGKERPSSAGEVEISSTTSQYPSPPVTEDTVRLALPDGHQQLLTRQLLDKAGIQVDDYPSPAGNRRPASNLSGVRIKIIRPQDMPLQVANGNFDLAVTGQDWLMEHRCQFPSSPVIKLVDLKFGKVKVVAVVSKDLPVSDAYSLRQLNGERPAPLRVASEYVNIADKYARDNHLGMYRIIPTWGATEAFLPEDADLLIENTQTGQTIARHNLKIIDSLFESVACLIGNKDSVASSSKRERIESITETLRKAAEDI